MSGSPEHQLRLFQYISASLLAILLSLGAAYLAHTSAAGHPLTVQTVAAQGEVLKKLALDMSNLLVIVTRLDARLDSQSEGS